MPLLLHKMDPLIWQEAALAVIKSQFGEIIQSQVHQTWGDRIVVEATTARFPAGIVLKASAEFGVRAEANAARYARDAGVPVPAILAEGRDDRLPGQDWFVMSRADGQAWESVAQSDVHRAKTLDGIGHAFALLHSVKLRGYGPLTSDLIGRFPSWSGWLHAELLSCSQPLIQAGYLPPNFMDTADDVFRVLAPELDNVSASLLHGDLGDREVFVDPVSGAVTAIVDWGGALSGDPRYDFARFVAGGPADDERPTLYRPGVKQAYARYTGCDPAVLDGKVSYLYEMHNAVGNACWCLREEPAWIEALCAYAMRMIFKLR